MPEVSADDRIILDRLLTSIAIRLHGAIDFWTMVCLGEIQNPLEFVRHYGDKLRAYIVVTRDLIPNGNEVIDRLLEELSTDCQDFLSAFAILAQFRHHSAEQVQASVATVVTTFHSLRESIRRIGEAIGLTVSYFQGRTVEKDQYIQNILNGLPEWFAQERTAKPPMLTVSADSTQIPT